MTVIINIQKSKTGKTYKVDEVEGICPSKRFKHPVDAHNHALKLTDKIKSLDNNIKVEIN